MQYSCHVLKLHNLKVFFNLFFYCQEVFNYSFDSALQSLISDFLYKIEQLFPVPDFKQVCSESDFANQLWKVRIQLSLAYHYANLCL